MKKIKITFFTGAIAFFAINFFSVKSYAFENQMIDVSNNTDVTNQLNDWDLTTIIDTIEYYRDCFPNDTDDEIINKVYDDIYNKQKYIGGLTSEEFWLIYHYLGISGFFKVNNLANDATKTTKEMYGVNNADDDSDAFRHMYLTSILYRDISKDFAQKLMTAHEAGGDKLNNKMDLHNNARAIILYEKWMAMNQNGELKNYLSHCVANGFFYNIKKIHNDALVYTDVGNNYSTYLNENVIKINSTYNSSMVGGDYQWYSFSSGNTKGKFSFYSSSDIDLKVEAFSSISKDASYIAINDDGGESLNFNVQVEMTYFETVYLKVYGYNDSQNGAYTLSIDKSQITSKIEDTFERYNKKMHVRISSDGTRKTEPHAVDSNHSRYTNCVLCGESLDTLVDGPFIVRWSLANSPVVALNSYNIVLNKFAWEKYLEGKRKVNI